MMRCGVLIATVLAGLSQAAHAAECSGPGAYPIARGRGGVSLEARAVKGKVVGTGFSAEPIVSAKEITPLGQSRGMVDDQLFDWNVAYAYRNGASNGIIATKLSVSVMYPAKRGETLNVRLTAGAQSFVSRLHRDPKMPNLSDVQADIPLPASAGGLFHPGEPGAFLVTDAVTGAPLLKGAVTFPNASLVEAALRAAVPNLKTECEMAAEGGMQF